MKKQVQIATALTFFFTLLAPVRRTVADDNAVRGRLSEAQEAKLRQQAANWRRNGNEARAREIEAQLAEEDWADSVEEFGQRARAWQQERDRAWEAEHGTPFVIHDPYQRDPETGNAGECPEDPAAGQEPDRQGPPSSSENPPSEPPQGPIPQPGVPGAAGPGFAPPPVPGGNHWGDYWREEGRGSNDAGGILDLFEMFR
ncbi:MAG: hypothetical protein HY720_06225 [Planctomycetes bacterium]|nr:hypothetical protein [Planctomycetota bacterium]